MTRNYAEEIDQLRSDVSTLKALMQQLLSAQQAADVKAVAPEQAELRQEGHIQKMPGLHPDGHVRAVLDQLENSANASGSSGRISYVGTYESGGNQSTWVRHDVSIDPLLQQIEDGSAARVLSCIGSNDRLRLLLALLKRPMTVQQMIAECGFNTTGQVYNHLRSLIAVDLVAEDEHRARGTYTVRPHRVSGLIMLLAGVNDLLDGEYTQADYSKAE